MTMEPSHEKEWKDMPRPRPIVDRVEFPIWMRDPHMSGLHRCCRVLQLQNIDAPPGGNALDAAELDVGLLPAGKKREHPQFQLLTMMKSG